MKTKFSIRYKFLFVTSMLLFVCVATYLLLAIRVFKMDKTELIFDLNRSMVTNLSSELETELQGVSDKLELFAVLSQEKSYSRLIVNDLLQENSSIVYISLVKKFPTSQSGPQVDPLFVNPAFLETYGLKQDFFSADLAEHKPIPFDVIQQEGEDIWNATIPDGPPLIGYARSIIKEDQNGNPVDRMAVVSFVKADKILKAISLVDLSEIFVLNHRGQLLVHKDVKKMMGGITENESPFIAKALSSELKTTVSEFNDDKGELVLGAYSKGYKGKIMVMALASGSKAFYAVRQLIRRSLMFSLIVVTAAFIAAIFFSRSLTQPIFNLLSGMNRVSEGDLNTEIKVKSHDEIAVLANSFNSMIRDLKESRHQLEEINRDLEDKVKDRTRQLEEQNQAVKEAQEALIHTSRLAAVGEIAGRAAHEVLNPLTSLMTRVQLVQKKLAVNQEPTMLNEIQQAWQKEYKEGGFEKLVKNWKGASSINEAMTLWEEDMTNIADTIRKWQSDVSDLMKDSEFLMSEGHRINKIVGGMRSLSVVRGDKKHFSAHKLLHDCVNIMADLFNQNEIEIEEKYTASKDDVLVDRDEFIQSVTNMLRNSIQAIEAAKAHDQLKGRVQVSTATQDGHFSIEIQDNGVGVPRQYQSKLFESQFTTKTHQDGTGLGLSISRRFIRAIGGDIELVESTPLLKTIFRIRVPLHFEEAVA